MTFDLDNLDDLIDYLEDYKNGLDDKARLISDRLADVGITIARQNVGGEYGSYLIFGKEFDGDNCIFYATDSGDIHVTWDGSEGYDVSPLLLCEFGSGQFADNPFSIPLPVGQGTMPNQTHAFDPNGWWWKVNGETHHSIGVPPDSPMYNASLEIMDKVVKVAREVFHVG